MRTSTLATVYRTRFVTSLARVLTGWLVVLPERKIVSNQNISVNDTLKANLVPASRRELDFVSGASFGARSKKFQFEITCLFLNETTWNFACLSLFYRRPTFTKRVNLNVVAIFSKNKFIENSPLAQATKTWPVTSQIGINSWRFDIYILLPCGTLGFLGRCITGNSSAEWIKYVCLMTNLEFAHFSECCIVFV